MLIETCLNYFLVLILFGCTISSFRQNGYTVEEDYAQVEYYNKSVIEFFHVKNVRLNRTYKGYSMDFASLIDVAGDSLKLNGKAFRFVNNQPTHLPFQYDVKVCEAIAKNLFGLADILNMGNITHCPIKKGYYYVHNFQMQIEQWPPFVPAGKYRLQLSMIYRGFIIARGSIYGNIVYKVKY